MSVQTITVFVPQFAMMMLAEHPLDTDKFASNYEHDHSEDEKMDVGLAVRWGKENWMDKCCSQCHVRGRQGDPKCV